LKTRAPGWVLLPTAWERTHRKPGPTAPSYGEGQGAMITGAGEPITWRGSGAGKLLPGGALSCRGILYYRTPSQKLARLNNACTVFEYEVDAAGNTTAKV
jgi:hypothetical protein